jgi:hypothetical protein
LEYHHFGNPFSDKSWWRSNGSLTWFQGAWGEPPSPGTRQISPGQCLTGHCQAARQPAPVACIAAPPLPIPRGQRRGPQMRTRREPGRLGNQFWGALWWGKWWELQGKTKVTRVFMWKNRLKIIFWLGHEGFLYAQLQFDRWRFLPMACILGRRR